MANSFQQIIDSVNNLKKTGALGLEDELFLKKGLRELEHALKVKNLKKIEKSVNKFCKKLLEKMQ